MYCRFIIGSLLLPLGCGGNDEPTGLDEPLVLQPTELCSDNPVTAIAAFEDAGLERRVRFALSVGAQEDLTCGLVSGLGGLDAGSAGIESVAGIQNLTNLSDHLYLNNNSISDISALSGLIRLRYLLLYNNSISDISALSGITDLTGIELFNNSITDISALSGLRSLARLSLNSNPGLSNIQPLLDNTGLGAGDIVFLSNTNVSCTDVALLAAKGVTLDSDCP